MVKDFFRNYVYPISTLAGSIIGVGFLSLPYIASTVGIWPMLFYFIIITALVVFLHVIFGQISLKTPDFKRFPGFAGFYLGNWAKIVTLVSIIVGSFGVLLAYVIIGSQFLTLMLQSLFGGSLFMYTLFYFALGSFLVYFGVKTISKVEFWALLILLVVLGILFFRLFLQIHVNNFSVSYLTFNISNSLLPYGAIMFSLWGTGLIPETEEMLTGNKKLLKKVIIISTLIPAAMYLLFIFLIVGVTGGHTTQEAITGLQPFLGQGFFWLALFIGVITTFTAFVTQGLLLKKVFVYDVNMKEGAAWFLTCATPLALFFLGLNSFIDLISFIGGVLLSLDGILILLMYQKIGGRKIVIYPLMLVFVLGIIYELIYFVK